MRYEKRGCDMKRVLALWKGCGSVSTFTEKYFLKDEILFHQYNYFGYCNVPDLENGAYRRKNV
jgi:hypothetical protein